MNLKIDKPIIFLDTETTSVNTTEARIVQIACIKYTVDGQIIEKDYLINPEIPIPVETTEIHGISDEMVANKPTFKQFSKGLRAFFEGCDIGGFNSNSYDINVLNEEFIRAGLEPINWNPSLVDVMLLYRQQYSGKLGDIYKRFFGEELDGAHSAIEDIRGTVRVLDKLLKDAEITCTSEELDVSLQDGSVRVDLAGKFYQDSEGVVRYAFGKDKDKSLVDYPSFSTWMLGQDFPSETKEIIRKLVPQKKK